MRALTLIPLGSHKWLFSIVLSTSVLSACHRQAQPTSTLRPATSPIPYESLIDLSVIDVPIPELIREIPFLEKEKQTALLRAWSGVANNRRYRAAQHADFENTFLTSDYGELAGANGLAALIVDKTINSPNRMSLIVFIERPGNRADLYWIYRDADLSKYSMSRASGDILVNEVHEDGSRSVCEIEWVKSEKRWTCKAY